MADIEARIAELILNEQESDNVVSRALAESVVAQLGFPDDLDTEEEPPVEKIPKRLLPESRRGGTGGVCSGLAAYFRTDPVWIRLAFFLPMLLVIFPTGDASAFFGSMFVMFVVLYIILWIAIPMARTPRQKLENARRKSDCILHTADLAGDASAMPPPRSASGRHRSGRISSMGWDASCSSCSKR